MPLAGRVLSPRARHLKIKSNRRDVVSRFGSKKIPPKKGRKNLPMMESENPSFLSKAIVGTSSAAKISSLDLERTRILVDPISSLSRGDPIGLVRDFAESQKWRRGSATV